ncbi:hypothetical protein B2J93_6546 [Marssonina coronariae]|uniref:C2H2-type domain-containing protein n=1 Tax=Diplocarpon coronariae TaxID=2795749 RepID=A0A218Z1H8_9HELO|nr:hypothetical protein B2J93_6546 [Marssonina coronariae]
MASPSSRRFPCSFPGCASTFSRQGDANRHENDTHRSEKLTCHYRGCNFKGTLRPGVLKKHWARIHQDFDSLPVTVTRRKAKRSVPSPSPRHIPHGTPSTFHSSNELSSPPLSLPPPPPPAEHPDPPPQSQFVESLWNDAEFLMTLYTIIKEVERSDTSDSRSIPPEAFLDSRHTSTGQFSATGAVESWEPTEVSSAGSSWVPSVALKSRYQAVGRHEKERPVVD